jgi:hypothetical protein
MGLAERRAATAIFCESLSEREKWTGTGKMDEDVGHEGVSFGIQIA